ncbi:MAG: MoaD/ThiS family protein [Pseudomonadota bacterium]
MTVKIVFLGPLRDIAGVESQKVAAPLDWVGLLNAVGPQVAEQLQSERVNIACAGRVLMNKADLSAQAGEEVALLPPVSGG